jgi:hypothetical protein
MSSSEKLENFCGSCKVKMCTMECMVVNRDVGHVGIVCAFDYLLE